MAKTRGIMHFDLNVTEPETAELIGDLYCSIIIILSTTVYGSCKQEYQQLKI